jgi:hypothetical protein
VADVSLLRRIWKFLVSWQLINFMARRKAAAAAAAQEGAAQRTQHDAGQQHEGGGSKVLAGRQAGSVGCGPGQPTQGCTLMLLCMLPPLNI